ncbi:6-phosphogluconolactonase [Microbacterium sorbitolivorans]|uniref:6-phosphogluconolactonase n=1 Tax=Microbacterium sorbitolivorans TaxID=1867410 RepID=UPI0019A0186D|nr:6-phosphogluconolactonase [Microbacterium sorbitolivorans]GGF32919.1 6-phosphogluconolactonase [Microbacterium sorbitolivorans]
MSIAREEVTAASKNELAAVAASRLIDVLAPATAERDAHVSLTGGSMGSAVLEVLAAHDRRGAVDWSRVHFWYSDERFTERESAERNITPAREPLAQLAGAVVHEPWSIEDGSLDDAAAAYAAELAGAAPEGAAAPAFDVVFLGVGPDAHIASLFPGRDEILATEATVLPIRNSPKPPPERVTFTLPIINGALRVWMVVAGADKAEAVTKIRANAAPQDAPAAQAEGSIETVLFLDEAAAGL